MQKSPLKDLDIGIPPRNWGPEEKFREVRHRARLAEDERKRKAKRTKKPEPEPKFKVGDKVVLSRGFQKRMYYLAEIIDYDMVERAYYGILRNTTDPVYYEKMLGHIVRFHDGHGGWWTGFEIQNVPPESVWKNEHKNI